MVAISETPPAEIQIDEALLRDLLVSQHPDLASQPITTVGEGWDNAIYKLGDGLALRLPRRAQAARLIEHEQRWLPILAERLPLPIPVPVRTGTPEGRFPWHWSVVPWLDGDTVDRTAMRPLEGAVFGAFLRSLHVPPPSDAPANPHRDVPLTKKAPDVRARLERIGERVPEGVTRIWKDGLASAFDVEPTWIHGDLHARNVLVADGAISGIIDWGDICVGDPATDLASFWTVLPTREARLRAMKAYGPLSGATLCRARAWAAFFGIILLDTGLTDHPQHAAMGAAILRRLRDDGKET